MAQLYKMTLYLCDLEDNLTIKEIEELIKYRALNGISTNVICKFTDEKIGKNIEWDEDIELNKCNCPVPVWESYFKNNEGDNKNDKN